MAKNFYDITLALSGIHQAASLAQQLAYQGLCDRHALFVMLNSIVQTDPPTTLAVFADQEANLTLGLKTILHLFSTSPYPTTQSRSHELIRYTMNMIILSRKLMQNPTILNELSRRLEQLKRQLQHFPIDSDNLIGSLADTYTELISPLGSKIHVAGSSESLTKPLVQAKVRAVLLAGIRSAVLWHQVGGRRLQLLLSRAKICAQATAILKNN